MEYNLTMISMPMNYEGWQKNYNKKASELESKGYNILPLEYVKCFGCNPPPWDSPYYTVKNKSLVYLGDSLQRMALCDSVYFVKGWEQARGCRIEHSAAGAYGLKLIYELNEGETGQ